MALDGTQHPHIEGILTARELQVMAMASDGLTNSQIASRLNLTVHGVKFHLASIYRKLGVANRTEAAVTFLRVDRAPNRDGVH